MKYNPHGYQTYAQEFIENHAEAAVLLDMGLGKTVIALTAINDLLFDRFEISPCFGYRSLACGEKYMAAGNS